MGIWSIKRVDMKHNGCGEDNVRYSAIRDKHTSRDEWIDVISGRAGGLK